MLAVFADDFIYQGSATAAVASCATRFGGFVATERPFAQSTPEVSIGDSLAVTNNHRLRRLVLAILTLIVNIICAHGRSGVGFGSESLLVSQQTLQSHARESPAPRQGTWKNE